MSSAKIDRRGQLGAHVCSAALLRTSLNRSSETGLMISTMEMICFNADYGELIASPTDQQSGPSAKGQLLERERRTFSETFCSAKYLNSFNSLRVRRQNTVKCSESASCTATGESALTRMVEGGNLLDGDLLARWTMDSRAHDTVSSLSNDVLHL